MAYELRRMTGERALEVLGVILEQLGDIDPAEMTTFELNIVRAVADNPPSLPRRGVEAG